MDTLLHLQSWISAGQMDYTLVYDKDFKLVLGPNEITSFSFGLSYRYLDLSLSFTPRFLNTGQDEDKEGESERIGFRTSFSMHRFNLSIDLNSVKGFILRTALNLRGVFFRIRLMSCTLTLKSATLAYCCDTM
jgi:hypothetical protein